MSTEILVKNINFLMAHNHLTGLDLDKEEVISKGYLSQLLSGKKNNIGYSKLANISNFFKIKIDILTNEKLNKGNVEGFVSSYLEENPTKSNSKILSEPNVEYELVPLKKNMVTVVPLFESPVAAGFPTDTFDYPKQWISAPPSKDGTLAIKVKGDSMEKFKIDCGDIILVEPTKEQLLNKILIVRVGNSFTCKKLVQENDRYRLMSGNVKYPPIDLEDDSEVIGLVVSIIKDPYS